MYFRSGRLQDRFRERLPLFVISFCIHTILFFTPFLEVTLNGWSKSFRRGHHHHPILIILVIIIPRVVPRRKIGRGKA
jgi:hypothetical protein